MAAKAGAVGLHTQLLTDTYKDALEIRAQHVEKDPDGVKRKMSVINGKSLVLSRGISTVREKRLAGLPIREDSLA